MKRVLEPHGVPVLRQVLSLRGHEFGIPPHEVAARWYKFQTGWGDAAAP